MRRAAKKPALPITGELTILTAGDLKSTVLQALEPVEDLTLDLAGVTEMDTAGLQVLLLVKREAEHLGKTVRFASPSEVVLAVLAIARLTPELDDDRPAELVESR